MNKKFHLSDFLVFIIIMFLAFPLLATRPHLHRNLEKKDESQNTICRKVFVDKIEKEATSATNLFSSLPQRVKIHIFSFLRVADAFTASTISKEWNRIIDDNLLWKSYALRFNLGNDSFEEKAQPSQEPREPNYKFILKELLNHVRFEILPTRRLFSKCLPHQIGSSEHDSHIGSMSGSGSFKQDTELNNTDNNDLDSCEEPQGYIETFPTYKLWEREGLLIKRLTNQNLHWLLKL